jgi:hypothetical protein
MPILVYKLSTLSALLVGLPLLGAALSGQPVAQYLEFPPLTRYVVHAPFSWPVFGLIAALSLAFLGALIWMVIRDRRLTKGTTSVGRVAVWPWWGWLGIATLLCGWILAWTRFAWFAELQPYTFTPLWLSYIVVINAMAWRRSGRCLLTHRPRFLAVLFPLSAIFWWYFEYLNRFVQNWYYIGIEEFTPAEYTLHATLAFSTVLPAVASTSAWWASVRRAGAQPISIATSAHGIRTVAVLVLVVSAGGLIGLSVWPSYLFPLLWIAPLLMLLALQGLHGEPTLISLLRSNGWQVVYIPALAALQCGFFWELWNYYSYAKWIYSVPFVHRFELFEMPILGYAGYLPFGIECAVVALLGADRTGWYAIAHLGESEEKHAPVHKGSEKRF